ncbi:OX2R-like protein [Mya arenaria]|uniref:OX2R-like protein n=1 Tax=Mya arenaria TaxID=6604 RepID=A0ABY7FS63_MYAAR|nr:OX2R-like protein [Mya arenaria]
MEGISSGVAITWRNQSTGGDSEHLFHNTTGNGSEPLYQYSTGNDSEHLYQSSDQPYIPMYLNVLVAVLNAIIFIIGVTGNILVITVILKLREMRTPTNVFLLNLSVADVLFLVVCQPAALLEFFGKDRWFLGEAMCKLVPLLENGTLHVSILTMLAVTFERYFALCHPLKQHMVCTISKTVKCLLLIWAVAVFLTVPFPVMTVLEDATFYDGTPTKVCRTKINSSWKYVAFFAIPLIILVSIYIKIIHQLMSDTLNKLTQNKRSALQTIARRQVVYMLILIMVLFFVTLFPIRVLTLWLIFSPAENVYTIGLEAFLNLISWSRILMYVNSAGNPIIYCLTSTKFKMAFKRLLKRNDGYLYVSYNTMTARFNVHRAYKGDPERARTITRKPIDISSSKSTTSGSKPAGDDQHQDVDKLNGSTRHSFD